MIKKHKEKNFGAFIDKVISFDAIDLKTLKTLSADTTLYVVAPDNMVNEVIIAEVGFDHLTSKHLAVYQRDDSAAVTTLNLDVINLDVNKLSKSLIRIFLLSADAKYYARMLATHLNVFKFDKTGLMTSDSISMMSETKDYNTLWNAISSNGYKYDY